LDSDDDLMSAVQRGDQSAFAKLVRRHGGAVFGMTMRLFSGNRARAEDVTQETWMKILEKCDSYQPQGHFRAWLMTIARNQALSELRKSARFTDTEEDPGEAVAVEFDLDAYLTDRASVVKMRALMDALPDGQRTALVLWLDGERSYEEISQEMGESLANVKNLIFRAKAAIQKKWRIHEKE